MALRFSFSKSITKLSSKFVLAISISDDGSMRTLPRLKPSTTLRVTDTILPMKSRAPLSKARSEVTGSCLRDRARAIVRPMLQAIEDEGLVDEFEVREKRDAHTMGETVFGKSLCFIPVHRIDTHPG
jgi:hypothetical protein